MGLRNNDTLVTRSTLTAQAGTYISIGTHPLEINRVSTGNYTLRFIATIWKDQTAREESVRSIQSQSYTIPIVERDIAVSMYATAYAYLETIYTNTTNV